MVMADLKRIGKPAWLPTIKRVGIAGTQIWGISVPDLRRIGKRLGTDQRLVRDLWETGIYDAEPGRADATDKVAPRVVFHGGIAEAFDRDKKLSKNLFLQKQPSRKIASDGTPIAAHRLYSDTQCPTSRRPQPLKHYRIIFRKWPEFVALCMQMQGRPAAGCHWRRPNRPL
jgi:hypothetical protein